MVMKQIEIVERCKAAGGITSWLLEQGLTWGQLPRHEIPEYATLTGEETISPVTGLPIPVFQIQSLDLPAGLNNPDAIEDEVVKSIFEHPAAVRMDLVPVGKIHRLLPVVLRMRQRLYEKKFYGPYVLILPPWESGGVDRLKKVTGVQDVLVSEKAKEMALVQVTLDVIRLIVCEDQIVPQVRMHRCGNIGIAVARIN